MALDTVAATVLPTVMKDEGFRAHLYLDANAKVAGVAQFRDMGRALAVAVKATDAELRETFFAAAAHEMLDSKWGRHDSPARAARRAREMATGKLARG